MKKIIFSAIVTPSDDSVTMENLKDALKHLGSAYFTFEAEVELASSEGMAKEVWLYASADPSEPYVKVSGPSETEGIEQEEAEMAELREQGVCVEFRAEYPRADRYGAPSYSTDDDFAAGVVGEHLFRVSAEDFTVITDDRGDDGAEQIWLKIVLPK